MKVKFYVDLYEGCSTQYLCAYTSPSEKQKTYKRYAFHVDLPDIFFPDKEIEGIIQAVEVSDETV